MQFAFIDEAIAILEQTNPHVITDELIQKGIFETVLQINILGKVYKKRFKLIKQLIGHEEIYEIRLDYNWDDPPTNWYLRLFFFKYEYNQQLYYCIADILEKDSTDLTDTNKMHKATLQTNAIARSLVVLRKQLDRNFARYAVYFN